jgi:hypothetical protein
MIVAPEPVAPKGAGGEGGQDSAYRPAATFC